MEVSVDKTADDHDEGRGAGPSPDDYSGEFAELQNAGRAIMTATAYCGRDMLRQALQIPIRNTSANASVLAK